MNAKIRFLNNTFRNIFVQTFYFLFYLYYKMTGQLQVKFAQLKHDYEILEEQLENNKQYYEETIRQLATQNQNLRKFIDDKTDSPIQTFKYSQDEGSPQYSIKKLSFDRANILPQRLPITVQATQQKQTELRGKSQLERENASLRKELSDMTRTYLQQVQQMNSYFVRIKQSYLQKIGNNNKEHSFDASSDQLKKFMDIYDKIMKDFDNQRKKYVQKIQELTNYIISCQEKEKNLESQNKSLRLELQIVKQQLKIHKRSKMTTKSVIR